MFQVLVYALEGNTHYYQLVETVVELTVFLKGKTCPGGVQSSCLLSALAPSEGVAGRRLAEWLGRELLHAHGGFLDSVAAVLQGSLL